MEKNPQDVHKFSRQLHFDTGSYSEISSYPFYWREVKNIHIRGSSFSFSLILFGSKGRLGGVVC